MKRAYRSTTEVYNVTLHPPTPPHPKNITTHKNTKTLGRFLGRRQKQVPNLQVPKSPQVSKSRLIIIPFLSHSYPY